MVDEVSNSNRTTMSSMDIYRGSLFGTKMEIIGTTHNSRTGTEKERMKNTLRGITPDLVCLEFPENGNPNQDIEDIKYGDVAGALGYCRDTGTEYQPVDKYIDQHANQLRKEMSEEQKRELRDADNGRESRSIIFENTNTFSSQIHKREQNIIENLIDYSGKYQNIVMIVGKSHRRPLINAVEMFRYLCFRY